MDLLPTTNLLTRVFPIRWNTSTGTAFVIDRDHRQYLITAKHMVDGITSGQELMMRIKHHWYRLKVSVVGMGETDIDVAVLSCNWPLANPAANLETDLSGIVLGQDVFVAGFPFGWGSQVRMGDQISDFPFVRKGTLSNLLGTEHRMDALVLDMHNNPGFSGSPVCFRPIDASDNTLFVAGVVSGYPVPKKRAVIDSQGQSVEGLFFAENSGFTVAHTIGCVTHIVDRNPVGLHIDWFKETLGGGSIVAMLKLAEEAGVSLVIPSTASTENI